MSKKKMYIYLTVCFSLLFVCIIYLVNNFWCTNGIYKININSRCLSNDLVGNDWSRVYTMDGADINNSVQIIAPLETKMRKSLKVKITEHDSIPDVASEEITFYLEDGETKKTTITVTEKNGKYCGNTALWEIEVSIKFIKKTMKKA